MLRKKMLNAIAELSYGGSAKAPHDKMDARPLQRSIKLESGPSQLVEVGSKPLLSGPFVV
jgi:hypothetical protein